MIRAQVNEREQEMLGVLSDGLEKEQRECEAKTRDIAEFLFQI
jgi:hypothetical protein